jgi:RHS repeat-associated protein
VGAPVPSVAAVAAGSGELTALGVAERVIAKADGLADFDAQMEAQWRDEAAEMTRQGVSSLVVQRHLELIVEVKARSAEFRELSASLRTQYAQRSVSGSSSSLVALSDWFSKLNTARGFRAISRAQLPLQLARAATTPAPGATVEKTAGDKAFTDPPGPADLAQTLDVQFTPEIQALAQSLDGPIAIRNWVYDQIEFMPTFGSIQGSGLTLLNRRGNAFDIASLTLALMRASGTPSRYVRSVIELPIGQVQNWVNAPTPEMALDLMQKGGIPSAAVIQGGSIQAIRFEHVWIEAWIDFIPSRGAINRVPDQWVPLDVAFKQFDYAAAVPWRQLTQPPRDSLVRDFAQRVTVGANRSVSGFDFDLLSSRMSEIAQSLADVLTATAAGSPVRFIDVRTIRPVDSLILEGSLPFPLRSTSVQRYSELPVAVRQTLTVRFYADSTSLTLDSPAQQVVLPLVRLGTQRLAVDYVPQTAADAQALAQYAESNTESMPIAQINVFVRLRLGNEVLFEHSPTRMGTPHFWRADIRDANGNSSSTEAYRFAAGSTIVFGADLAGMSPERVERESVPLPDSGSVETAVGLYLGSQLFWMLHDHTDALAISSVGARGVRLPSIGAFAQPLQVRYFFGVPRTGSVIGEFTDVKAVRLALAAPNTGAFARAAHKLALAGSLAEGAAWALLGGNDKTSTGLSTTTLIKLAIDDGQHLFQIDNANVTPALATLQLSADAENEIRQAASSGLIVVAPEQEVAVRGWRGSGYMIMDAETGNSLQRVDGGFAGGICIDCVSHALALDGLARTRILKRAREYLQTVAISDDQRELALAGLAKLYAETDPDPAVLLPIIASVGLSVSVAMAAAEAQLWLRGIIDGSERLTAEELGTLGIASLQDQPCTQPGMCEGGGLGGGHGGGGFGGFGAGGFGAGGPSRGNPVAAGTGTKWQSETDFQGSGPFPLRFTRAYVSAAARTSHWMGAKWTASYFQSIKLPPAQNGGPFPVNRRPDSVLLLRPSGSWFQFNWRTTAYVSDTNIPGHLERLTQAGNTIGWEYTDTVDMRERYDANGRLLSISNRAELSHTISYDPQFRPRLVTDSFGRTLQFAYDPVTGYLASFRDPLDQPYEFKHNADGNLIEIKYPDGKKRQYHYDDLNQRYHLTGITDERGVAMSSWTYDHLGRVRAHSLAGGVGAYSFRYEKDKTIEIDPLGALRTYEYDRIFGRLYLRKVSQLCTDCGGIVSAETKYDDRGLVNEQIDFRGIRTLYTRDARGMVTQMIEAYGTPLARTTNMTWHPQWYLPTQIVAPSATGTQITTLSYDAEGNLERRSINADGQVRQWNSTYNSNGQMLTMNGPRTDVTDVLTSTYDAEGNRDSSTDAVGNRTDYLSFDPAGRVLRMRDSNGVTTDMSYHPRGWLLTNTVRANPDGSPGAGDALTRIEYEATGDVKRVTQPDGVATAYCRDEARRISAMVSTHADSPETCNGALPVPGFENVVYQLDGAGNRTREEVKDPSGVLTRVLARQYNDLGQLRAHINAPFALAPLDDPGVLKTHFSYDGNGNQLTQTDPLGRVADNQYDELNRLKQTISDSDDANPTTVNIAANVHYEHDAANNLRRVIDPNRLVTDYTFDGLNNLTRLYSPDTGSSIYANDEAGNRTRQTDARNVQTIYRYDALNRLSFLEYPSDPGKTVQFRYDQNHPDCAAIERNGKARLTEMIDASGRSTFCYDHRGNLSQKTQVTQGRSLVLRYRYNAADRLIGTTYPSGLDLNVTRDPLGRIQKATVIWQGTTIPLVTDLGYRPFGPVQSVAFANGQTLSKSWDQNYWPDLVTSPAFNYDYTTDPVGNIIVIDSSSDPARVYEYDRLDRLNNVREANQTPIEAYGYDATGNRTSRTTSGAPEVYSYNNTPPSPVLPGSPNYGEFSHRLQSVGAIPRTYDAAGNTLTGIPELNAQNAQAEYDARNRLTGIRVSANNYLARYEYNGRGERVVKYVGADASLDLYEESGQLLGRYRISTSPGSTWTQDEELVWLDNMPVASVRIENNQPIVHAILSDHLNTPRALTTLRGGTQPLGTTVWKWSLAGQVSSGNNAFGTDVPNEDPDLDGTLVRFYLRFPGQQYDSETRLHYNYFRDYEPGTGRYVESDPVGQKPSFATYTYLVRGPLSDADIFGLAPKIECGGTSKADVTDAINRMKEGLDKCIGCKSERGRQAVDDYMQKLDSMTIKCESVPLLIVDGKNACASNDRKGLITLSLGGLLPGMGCFCLESTLYHEILHDFFPGGHKFKRDGSWDTENDFFFDRQTSCFDCEPNTTPIVTTAPVSASK